MAFLTIERLVLLTAAVVVALASPTAVDALAGIAKMDFSGAGVGRLNMDELAGKAGTWDCHYDMILVERLQKQKGPRDVEEDGLFVPDSEMARLHLCQVLSKGAGREEENGMVSPNINNLEVGDLVIAKHPWGIGPKDEELADGTKLSFMREIDIAAKITGELSSK
jgi:co-chaperonin GroES (HSP10)